MTDFPTVRGFFHGPEWLHLASFVGPDWKANFVRGDDMIRHLLALFVASALLIVPAPSLQGQVGGPGGCHLCGVHDFGPGQICDICIHHTFFGYGSCAQISCENCYLQGPNCGVYAEVPEALLENRRRLLEAAPGGLSIAVAGRWIDVTSGSEGVGDGEGLSCAEVSTLEALLWASATILDPLAAGV